MTTLNTTERATMVQELTWEASSLSKNDLTPGLVMVCLGMKKFSQRESYHV